jgi:hypothetical protein
LRTVVFAELLRLSGRREVSHEQSDVGTPVQNPKPLAGLAGVGVILLLATKAWAPQYTGGPSVRVNPNVSVEFKWITEVSWLGVVRVFNNPDGLGTPLVGVPATDAFGNPLIKSLQDVTVNVVTPLTANTGYFFQITATDPNLLNPDLVTPTPLPPFFTGAQTISNVSVQPDINSAVISWEANVIGLGSVLYGITSLSQGPVEDTVNITDHAIEITGLSAGTTYQFSVCNKHAIDRDCLATATGQFTTGGVTTAVVLTQPQATPRVIQPSGGSVLTVKTLHQGQPVAGVVVSFAIDSGSSGNATFGGSSSTHATTDTNGMATVQLTGTASGLVRVNVTSANAPNSLTMPVIVH